MSGAPEATPAGRLARRPAVAALASGMLLLAIYLLTLAPSVTFWDAGEFLAAFESFGIPHPPGTPLYVAFGRAWSALLPVDPAVAGNALSALCSAGAGAALAWLLARRVGDEATAVAAAVGSGVVFSVWANATETEVYAAVLLLVALTLVAAERAARRPDDPRAEALVAYAIVLAVPLHLAALVAAPSAALLASSGARRELPGGTDAASPDPGIDRARLARLSGVAVFAMGAARVSWWLAAIGGAIVLAGVIAERREARPPLASPSSRRSLALGLLGVAAVALSPLVVLLVRATFDPAINQGNPATWSALVDVVARRQYASVSPLERQAPLWLQLGNVLQWADWQFAFGLAPRVEPAWARTPITITYALLGAVGLVVHRRRDEASFRALLMLLVAGTLGVALYLNLKAGPSYGHGVLPEGAAREARERDYFYAFGFWVWGAWAALGAATLVGRVARGRLRAAAMVAVALVPVALNWRAADRRRSPDAGIPAVFARALLESAPRNAILFVAGDNDTYPLWLAQRASGIRRDVAVVTIPLLPAAWYRRELERRHGLEGGESWRGVRPTLATLADAARAEGRPIVAAVSVPAVERAALGRAWRLSGLAWVETPGGAAGLTVDDASAFAPALETLVTAALRTADARVGRGAPDPTGAYVRTLLRCPELRLGAERDGLLASPCNYK